jgi:hypothetical protein
MYLTTIDLNYVKYMPENNKFYVYCHRRKTDGKCFYIGKGTGNRSETTYSRNRYWYENVKEHGFVSEILINNISEQKAFEFEAIICKQIGYNNLINIRKEKGWGGHSHSQETINKLSKPVLQYTKDGILIKKWRNATEAALLLGKHPSAITECCRGFRQSIYGFTWRHIDNPIHQDKKYIPKKKKQIKNPPYYNPIDQYDLEGNFIQTWHNAKTAGNVLGIIHSSISSCISGTYKSSGGFKWTKSLDKKGGISA